MDFQNNDRLEAYAKIRCSISEIKTKRVIRQCTFIGMHNRYVAHGITSTHVGQLFSQDVKIINFI